ncbi:MAG: PhoH family protein [Clostridia bacterium]|nr:PhoH family protein [Clostridia bacterium]
MRSKIAVETQSVDRLSRVLGAFDENLDFIARELGVTAFVDGLKIVIEGEEKQVKTAFSVLNALVALAAETGEIDKTKTAYCLELALEDRAEEILSMSEGVVAVTYRGKQIRCKTVGQKEYVEKIRKNAVTFGVGPAGTGKTYLAVCMAVAAFKTRRVDKIILTRPAVEAGEHLGFLPGDLGAKVDPYLRPLYDALQELLGLETYAKLLEKGVVEVAPLAYMRGRTLSNAFIILDEAQNTTKEQMKMFLTRMGEGSQIVVTGDVTQIDLPEGKKSGLIDAVETLTGVEGVAVCKLTAKDVVRHPLVMRIIRAYEKKEQNGQANEKKSSGIAARKEETNE